MTTPNQQNVKKVAPYYSTEIYALLPLDNTDKIKQNTVYIYEGIKKKVINHFTITSTVTDVFYVQTAIVFFGFDEVYICDPNNLEMKRTIKACAGVGDVTSLLMTADKFILACRHSNPEVINIVDLVERVEDSHFQPFAEEKPVSYVSFCQSVIFCNLGNANSLC